MQVSPDESVVQLCSMIDKSINGQKQIVLHHNLYILALHHNLYILEAKSVESVHWHLPEYLQKHPNFYEGKAGKYIRHAAPESRKSKLSHKVSLWVNEKTSQTATQETDSLRAEVPPPCLPLISR